MDETEYVNGVQTAVIEFKDGVQVLDMDDAGTVLAVRNALDGLRSIPAPATLAVLGYYVEEMYQSCNFAVTVNLRESATTNCSSSLERVVLQIATAVEKRGVYPPTPAP